MKYTIQKETRVSAFGEEIVYVVYMETTEGLVYDCYFNTEKKARAYVSGMSSVDFMDTGDLRDAISNECEMNPRTKFWDELEQTLHDTECDLFKAYNNPSFIEQAQIKIRKMIKAVEEQKKS